MYNTYKKLNLNHLPHTMQKKFNMVQRSRCKTSNYKTSFYKKKNPHNFRYFANKGLSSQGYGFSGGHVWMWELDCEESWVLKNWCFWTVVLEKTLESPLDCKEIQPVHPKGDQSWVFIGRTNAEAETPILWPPHAKSWLTGKDQCWEGLGAGEGDDRGSDGWMASPTLWTWVWVNSGSWWWTGRPGNSWGGKQLDMTEWLNWTELNWTEPAFHSSCCLPIQ